MTDDEHPPRHGSDISDEEIEEMVRDAITTYFRPDIAERALAWLDERLATKH
jgi:hypothetical protein